MRILFALSGLHRVDRGAEVAFTEAASALARAGDDVTLIGSGGSRPGAPYRFLHAGCIRRQRFEFMPSVPGFRDDCAYEELTFAGPLLARYRPADYDVTLTCGYPYTNWILRARRFGAETPRHVFVTQNGDWPAFADNSEFRFFGCDGLICTNPDFYDRNKARWRCALIPNGVDTGRFRPGPPRRDEFGLPANARVVLMVSALIPSKRVELGIEAVSRIPGCHLVVAGDGAQRKRVDERAARLMPGRFTRITVAPDRMPALYRSADVFMHLSEGEAFGNVFVEAMACGLPVVAPDSPRLRWIVGDDEYLAATDDPGEIGRQVIAAFGAPRTREGNCPEKAARFAWHRIGAQYRDFLMEIAGAAGRSPAT
jgi:glycosyltransferase involved in cell wall biosynthesis